MIQVGETFGVEHCILSCILWHSKCANSTSKNCSIQSALDIDIENGRILGYNTHVALCAVWPAQPLAAPPRLVLCISTRPLHRPCSGDLVTTTTTITAAAAAAAVLLLLLGVGVVLQWCADVPVLLCAVVCRRWSPAVAAARQRARGGAGASVAQSSGGEHGSQAPAHTEHTVMVTLGHSSPRPVPGQQ